MNNTVNDAVTLIITMNNFSGSVLCKLHTTWDCNKSALISSDIFGTTSYYAIPNLNSFKLHGVYQHGNKHPLQQ